MSQTILIEANEDLSKIYSLNLQTFVGTDIILRKNAEEALALLHILPEVALIITQLKINQEDTALDIYRFIKSEGLNTKLIVLGTAPELAEEVVCIQDPVSWETLVKEAAHQLGVTLKDATAKIQPDYLPVASYFFYEIQKVPCDIFIRIKKSNHEYMFVKRLHSKDVFDKSLIKKYEGQGLKEFYVQKDYIQFFTTFVTNNIVQKLEQTDLTLEDRILTTASGHAIVRDMVATLGLETSAVELSDASINSMTKSVKDSPKAGPLIKFLFSNKVSFAYQHCHILALMSHYVLSKQSWYKEEHLYIMSFAAFFADVTLHSSVQMQIATMSDLFEANLTDEEKNQVTHHAKDAVDLLKDHPKADNYVKTVILQSHGTLTGIGFEDNPGEDLHPLSKVFVVADSFVKILLNPSLPSTKKEILPLLYGRFKNPSYQKIIKALEQKYE